MKISNETKVGVLSIFALVVLILGFNFLKGKSLFTKTRKIYAVFSDLGPLSKSNEVKINGYVIGTVYDLDARDKDISGIIATINLTKDVNIPADSKAYISSPLVGSSFIAIEKGDSTVMLKVGDTLQTRVDAGILDDVKAQLNPTINKIRQVLDTLTLTLTGVNGVLTVEARINLHQVFSNLNAATSSLASIVNPTTGALGKTLNNTEAITDNLKKNNEAITATIGNAKKASEKLAALEIQPTIDSLSKMVNTLKSFIAKLDNPNGTIGSLMNDKSIYNKLKDAILGAEILIDDLKAHPKRYVNISIFGRKDKGGYLNSPLPKDSLPPKE